MADGPGEPLGGLPAISVTAGGVTVLARPCGWLDMVRIPEELERITGLPTGTPDEQAELRRSILAFAELLDSYAAGDVKPSRVPPWAMREWVVAWVTGVRDAAVPPASGGSSRRPSRASRTSR